LLFPKKLKVNFKKNLLIYSRVSSESSKKNHVTSLKKKKLSQKKFCPKKILSTGDRRALASKEERATRWDRKTETLIIEGSVCRYQGLPRNIHRHVIMSEYQEPLGHLPPELKEANTMVSTKAPAPAPAPAPASASAPAPL
jgi:hypothetical protein